MPSHRLIFSGDILELGLYLTPEGDVGVFQRNTWGKYGAGCDFQGRPTPQTYMYNIYIYTYMYIFIYTQHSFLSGCQIHPLSTQWRSSFLRVLRIGSSFLNVLRSAAPHF